MTIRSDSKIDGDNRWIQTRCCLRQEDDRLDEVFEPYEVLEARMIFES